MKSGWKHCGNTILLVDILMKRLIFIICLLLFGIVVFFLARSYGGVTMNTSVQKAIIQEESPTPTPMPFAEMTIPYLRNRTYSSSIGPRTRIADSGTYMSYMTNYDSDGLKINGLLTIPKGEMPLEGWPAIVFVHGYIPPTVYRTKDNYVAYVDYLARRGFVVFKIDLRGHDQSEGEPGGAYYSSDYVIDALNARAALQTVDFVHPKRIGLWGHSMAGNVVMRSLVAQPEIPAVAVWAGAGYTYADLLAYRISDTSWRPPTESVQRVRGRELLRQTYGEFSADHPFWKQVAVTDYLGDIQGAIELHHAVDDAVVNVEYSRNLTKLLEKTKVAHTLYEYAGGGHNISGAYFTTAMERTAEFFKKNL